ncbi:DUF7287 family protein [Halostella salina]|uniref:DUF7287 family protein n=1 Tax=Halostella salina TaxID=1547897 RepID=UPI000EF7F038|nr:hypothetical protein [Halostella salina]
MIGDERGQTAQDFAVGISVFLLTTAFLFAFLPTIFTPFDEEVTSGDSAQADRVASTFVDGFSADGQVGTLRATDTSEFFDEGNGGDDLRDRYALSTVTRVNVTIRTQNGTVIREVSGTELKRGDDYDGRPSASASRIVTFDSGTICSPTCRLVVRVW